MCYSHPKLHTSHKRNIKTVKSNYQSKPSSVYFSIYIWWWLFGGGVVWRQQAPSAGECTTIFIYSAMKQFVVQMQFMDVGTLCFQGISIKVKRCYFIPVSCIEIADAL